MLKHFLKYRKKAITYFSRHVELNALAHVLGGIGLGILIAPSVSPHPLRWALSLLVVSLSIHFYALMVKK